MIDAMIFLASMALGRLAVRLVLRARRRREARGGPTYTPPTHVRVLGAGEVVR